VDLKHRATFAKKFARNAVDDFYETVEKDKYGIVKAVYIQNIEIWRHHRSLENKWLDTDRISRDSIYFTMLWHGTTTETVNNICEKGFVKDLSVTKELGKGVYFAKDPQYSIDKQNLQFDNHNKHAELLYCRIICGESVLGKESFLKPPAKEHVDWRYEQYETMVDDKCNPTIYVCCTNYQAYPCLKLTIKKLQ